MSAMWTIIAADITMSLDNVLAVAAAAREHPYIMAFGLFLSVVLMGVAASYIARLLDRHRWIGWAGLLLIVYVALRLIWDGWPGVAPYFGMSRDPVMVTAIFTAGCAFYAAAEFALKRRTAP
jgi:predicted tellurium resistance membrane protein TerC